MDGRGSEGDYHLQQNRRGRFDPPQYGRFPQDYDNRRRHTDHMGHSFKTMRKGVLKPSPGDHRFHQQRDSTPEFYNQSSPARHRQVN